MLPQQEEREATCNPLDPLLNEHKASNGEKSQSPAPPSLHGQEDYNSFDIVRATQYGIFQRVQQLIDTGYDVNQMDHENVSLLHWAAINNRTEIVSYFMSKGAVVDRIGGFLDATPLHWATRQGHLTMVVQLMSYGADPSLRDGEGCSCIHLASQFGHTAIVAYLIAKGQDVDMVDKTGMTPLMWAAHRVFSYDPVRLLFTFGASLNKTDKQYGNTALHWACDSANHLIIKVLLGKGADINAINFKGESPLDIAISKSNQELVIKLRALQSTTQASKNSIMGRYASNKNFRRRLWLWFPFFAVFFIGFVPELSISWMSKVAIALPLIFLGNICFKSNNLNCPTYEKEHPAILETLDDPRYISEIKTDRKTIERYFFDDTYGNKIPVAVYLGTKFWMYVTWFFYLWPYLDHSIQLHTFWTANTILLAYNFYKAWSTDPGYLKSNREDKIKTILELAEAQTLKLDQFCSTCLIRKPLRSKHCSICNKCVAKFDHHCPWVDNCIGFRNHKYFIGFLFFLAGMLGFCVYGCYQFWQKECQLAFYEDGITGTVYKIVMASPWVAWIGFNALAHITWVVSLFACQMYQIVYLAMTTNERMNQVRYFYAYSAKMAGLKQDGCRKKQCSDGHSHGENGPKIISPFDRGVFKNLVDLLDWRCMGLLRPLQTDWTQKYTMDDDSGLSHDHGHLHPGRENYQFV